ncbi:MAG: hypothetical protein Q4C68_04925, partial [Moraxella sp.]|nr:hypothetical protein [Moraxella sp.]
MKKHIKESEKGCYRIYSNPKIKSAIKDKVGRLWCLGGIWVAIFVNSFYYGAFRNKKRIVSCAIIPVQKTSYALSVFIANIP